MPAASLTGVNMLLLVDVDKAACGIDDSVGMGEATGGWSGRFVQRRAPRARSWDLATYVVPPFLRLVVGLFIKAAIASMSTEPFRRRE